MLALKAEIWGLVVPGASWRLSA